VADLQLQVPQAIEDRLDDALAPRGLLVGEEEQQVDVGAGGERAAAVAAGRMDLVRDLANDCQDEALDLMLALGGGTPSQPEYDAAEILEFGGGWPQRRRAGRPGTWRFRFWRYNRS